MKPVRREAHRGSLRDEVDTAPDAAQLAIGRKKLRAYAHAGIDRLTCFQQVGAIPHERVLSALTPILD